MCTISKWLTVIQVTIVVFGQNKSKPRGDLHQEEKKQKEMHK